MIARRTKLAVRAACVLSSRAGRVVELVAIAAVAYWTLVDVLGPEARGGTVVLGLGGLLAWASLKIAIRREAKKLEPMYLHAFTRGDADLIAELRALLRAGCGDPRISAANDALLRGAELLLRKQWSEARDAFASIDRAVLPRADGLIVANHVAYATARSGEPDRAITLAREALATAASERAPGAEKAKRTLESTLGIALAIGGQHADALPLLERGAADAPAPRTANERAYWLGRTYAALGRDDEAVRWLRNAAESAGPCTEEAKALLAERTPFRG